MAEIETQLRAYAAAVLDRVEPVSEDDVTEIVPSPRRSRRRLGLVAAVALVAALLGAPTAWIAWRSSDSGVSRVTSGRRALPTNWTRVDALGGAQVNASASSPSGVVAVGAGIWFSRDGQTWAQVLAPADVGALSFPQQGSIADVTAAGRGFVAAGQAVDPASGQAVAAIWTSPDGEHWSRVRDPDLEPPTPPIPAQNTTPTHGSIAAVTRGGPGFVAVGAVFAGQFRGATLGTAPYEPAVWTSRNGAPWKRVDLTTAVGTGPSSWALTDVVAHNGSVYATATVGGVTVILESNGGSHWQRLATTTGTFNQVVRYRGSLVAVGSQTPNIANRGAEQRAAIWTSADARHWHRVAISAPALHSRYLSVAVRGRSLVAIGIFGHQEVFVDGIMSVSNDGHTWQPVTNNGPNFAPQTALTAVTAFGGRYLAFGTETTQGQGTPSDPYGSRNDLFISMDATASSRDTRAPLVATLATIYGCIGPNQSTTTAVASVVDPEPGRVASVELVFVDAGGTEMRRQMRRAGGGYEGPIGPYEADGDITWQVIATDKAGNSTTQSGPPVTALASC